MVFFLKEKTIVATYIELMNTSLLLPLFYFPPISWLHFYAKENTTVLLESKEHFPKQTYRNRTVIYGANGKLPLIIPIRHSGKRVYDEIEISYAENWQSLHWKSIKTAYQSSPYFEFYEDALEDLFTTPEPLLFQFNEKVLAKVLELLKWPSSHELTTVYEKNIVGEDLREKFSAKSPSEYSLPPYYQTFDEKFGFQNDLSVLDLLCNKGPESSTYIKQLLIN